MLFLFGTVQLLVFIFQIHYAQCLKGPKTTSVEITTFKRDQRESHRLMSLMKTGNLPFRHSPKSRIYHVANITCTDTKWFWFSLGPGPNQRYKCPTHDGEYDVSMNETHYFMCPAYCEVCKKKFECSKFKAYSGIQIMPDGRKKDQLSFQYSTLNKEVTLEIEWLIVTCYVLLFTLFTNIVVFVFTDY
ncbi:hypothetical protein CRE_11095 [Caenorhabditis remanei]|uniref:Uncharacterized protein n=1 Tax=Caenorhabditis remanei TaxID=31234 RepID=E3M5I6_CAERE|nr:hypothetical protein CRE_11095 [Caenorhabditis remanei]